MGTRDIVSWLVRSAVLVAMVLGPRGVTIDLSMAGLVHAAPAQQDGGAIPVGSDAWVTGTGDAGVNVRSAPLLSSDVVDSLSEGDPVEVVEGPVAADGIDWYRVSSTWLAGSGWVAGDYLSTTAPGQ